MVLTIQSCDDHVFRHAVSTSDAMTTRYGNQLRFCLAGQKRLAFANAPVGTLGQILRMTAVGDGQHVLGISALRNVFTLLEVTDGVVCRRASGEPVCLPVACMSVCVCSRETRIDQFRLEHASRERTQVVHVVDVLVQNLFRGETCTSTSTCFDTGRASRVPHGARETGAFSRCNFRERYMASSSW